MFHIVYAVPSDVEPAVSDEQIQVSLQVANQWLADQTGGVVTFDLHYEGVERLPLSDQELLEDDQFSALVDSHLSSGTYVVLYGGTPISPVCGFGSPGGAAVVYVKGCDNSVLAGNGIPFGPIESVTIHEIMHVLGLPDQRCGTGRVDDSGHIAGSTGDIMNPYGGPSDGFDPGNDDYFMPTVTAESAPACRFLTSAGTIHIP